MRGAVQMFRCSGAEGGANLGLAVRLLGHQTSLLLGW